MIIDDARQVITNPKDEDGEQEEGGSHSSGDEIVMCQERGKVNFLITKAYMGKREEEIKEKKREKDSGDKKNREES